MQLEHIVVVFHPPTGKDVLIYVSDHEIFAMFKRTTIV